MNRQEMTCCRECGTDTATRPCAECGSEDIAHGEVEVRVAIENLIERQGIARMAMNIAGGVSS